MALCKTLRLINSSIIRRFVSMDIISPVGANIGTSENAKDGLKECIQHRADREVICGDSLDWLNKFEDDGLPSGYCGFTSLPDLSELHNIFQTDTVGYKKWFTDTVALFMSKLSRGTYVVFLQSDIRYMSESGEVSEWIDKSHLCSNAADRTGCTLMWHKLVYTDKDNNKRSTGRPAYSHLLCYAKPRLSTDLGLDVAHERLLSKTQARKERSKQQRLQAASVLTDDVPDRGVNLPDSIPTTVSSTPAAVAATVVPSNYRTSLFAVPDVFYRGHMLWPKGIGLDSCFVGVMFLKDIADAAGIIDPFAGQGTVLAMANAVNLPAIGVEISPKRCRRANNLEIDLDLISPNMRKIALEIVAARAEAALKDATPADINRNSSESDQKKVNKEDNENSLVQKLSNKTVHIPRKKDTSEDQNTTGKDETC